MKQNNYGSSQSEIFFTPFFSLIMETTVLKCHCEQFILYNNVWLNAYFVISYELDSPSFASCLQASFYYSKVYSDLIGHSSVENFKF